jgi:hypothetical protein
MLVISDGCSDLSNSPFALDRAEIVEDATVSVSWSAMPALGLEGLLIKALGQREVALSLAIAASCRWLGPSSKLSGPKAFIGRRAPGSRFVARRRARRAGRTFSQSELETAMRPGATPLPRRRRWPALGRRSSYCLRRGGRPDLKIRGESADGPTHGSFPPIL